jgi:hypothetical protein
VESSYRFSTAQISSAVAAANLFCTICQLVAER